MVTQQDGIFKQRLPLQRTTLSERKKEKKNILKTFSFIAYNSEIEGHTENVITYRMIGL